MSILINSVQRRNPSKPEEPLKWYPVQNSTGLVDETQVAELIADETTLNPAEALMAIRQLRKVTERLLLDGHSVRLGNWATINVTLHSTGAATKAELTARNIQRVNVNMQPGEGFLTAMQKAEFVWLDKLANSGGNSTPSTPDEGGDDIL